MGGELRFDELRSRFFFLRREVTIARSRLMPQRVPGMSRGSSKKPSGRRRARYGMHRVGIARAAHGPFFYRATCRRGRIACKRTKV